MTGTRPIARGEAWIESNSIHKRDMTQAHLLGELNTTLPAEECGWRSSMAST